LRCRVDALDSKQKGVNKNNSTEKKFMFTKIVGGLARTLSRNRWHSVINILGLTLGISCAVIIFSIVRFHLSYDTYHPQKDRIYRIVTERNRFGEKEFTAGTTYPLPEALRQDFPELEYVTIVDANTVAPVINVASADGSSRLFKEVNFAFADPDYFKIFKYDWIEGSPEQALDKEKTVVITESTAKKYFGGETALGKVLSVNGKYSVTVSGVIRDIAPNTDLPYKLIFSNRLGADAHAWTKWGSSFALSSSLIIAAIVMNKQMQFVATKDLGYQSEAVLVLGTQSGWNDMANEMVQRFRIASQS
jgi:putative ABC transport system permease protein